MLDKGDENTKQTTIIITRQQDLRLGMEAIQTNQTRSQIIRDLLDTHFNQAIPALPAPR